MYNPNLLNNGLGAYPNYNNAFNNQPIQSVKIPQVHGKPGAEAFRLGSDSAIFLVDETEDNTVWLKTTDSAGFATLRKARLNFVDDEVAEKPEEVSKADFDELKEKVNKLWEELHE